MGGGMQMKMAELMVPRELSMRPVFGMDRLLSSELRVCRVLGRRAYPIGSSGLAGLFDELRKV